MFMYHVHLIFWLGITMITFHCFFQAMVICATWLFLFGFLSSFSPHYYWIIALRCLVGFGIGGVPLS